MSDEQIAEIRAQIEAAMKNSSPNCPGIVIRCSTVKKAYEVMEEWTAYISHSSAEEVAMLREHPELTEEQRRQFWEMRRRDRRADNAAR